MNDGWKDTVTGKAAVAIREYIRPIITSPITDDDLDGVLVKIIAIELIGYDWKALCDKAEGTYFEWQFKEAVVAIAVLRTEMKFLLDKVTEAKR